MEARDPFRKTQLLDACQVAPAMFEQVVPRLDTFMEPLVTIFQGQGDDQHANTSVGGLLSDVERQHIASMASRCGQSRLPLQRFLGSHAWDDEPVRQEWRSPVTPHWGPGDGGLVCDPSGFAKSGCASVGVARQWGGRRGQVDTCQVALEVGDVSRTGHPLVATRLSLPNAWTTDQARLDHAGGPQGERSSRTRHPLAVEMLANNGAGLPPRWRAGDDERGGPAWLRRRLATWGARSLLAVPSHTTRRALEVAAPAASGRGRRPQRPWHSVEGWSQSLAEETGRRLAGRDSATGPLGGEAVQRRVVSRTHRRQPGDEESLGVIRDRDRENPQVVQGDSSRSNAVPETPLGAWARVAKAAQRLDACLQRSTSEAGVAEYAGRHGTGWHQHQTLSFLATGLLVRETERGKTMAPCDDLPADAPGHRDDLARGVAVRHDGA